MSHRDGSFIGEAQAEPFPLAAGDDPPEVVRLGRPTAEHPPTATGVVPVSRTATWLVARAVRLLPPSHRARDAEEFSAELADLSRVQQRAHACRVLSRSLTLRRNLAAAINATSQDRFRLLVPLASAAAVLVIAFATVVVAAKSARPGDALWGLTRVLYSNHARSLEAAAVVRENLDSARQAMREGRMSDAEDALTRAQVALSPVAPEDCHSQLNQQHELLSLELATGSTKRTPSANSGAR